MGDCKPTPELLRMLRWVQCLKQPIPLACINSERAELTELCPPCPPCPPCRNSQMSLPSVCYHTKVLLRVLLRMSAQQQRLDVALRMFEGAAYALHPFASNEIIANIEARDTGAMLQNALHGNRHPLIPQHTLGQIHFLDIFRSLVDLRSEAETSISPQVPAAKDSWLERGRARAHARTHACTHACTHASTHARTHARERTCRQGPRWRQ